MPKLTTEQLAQALKYQPQQLRPQTKPTPLYDPENDDTIASMFNRRWDEYEVFSPEVLRCWSLLADPILGNPPNFEDMPLLLEILNSTRNEMLRKQAVAALRNHLSDVSGIDCSLKPMVQEALDRIRQEGRSWI